jgi:hypothetical protein
MQTFDIFPQDLASGEHQLDADQLRIALTVIAPDLANTVLSDLTEIDYTDLTDRDVATTLTKVDATSQLSFSPLNIINSGSLVSFRYVVLYNTVNSKLIGFQDYGSNLDLNTGETFRIVGSLPISIQERSTDTIAVTGISFDPSSVTFWDADSFGELVGSTTPDGAIGTWSFVSGGTGLAISSEGVVTLDDINTVSSGNVVIRFVGSGDYSGTVEVTVSITKETLWKPTDLSSGLEVWWDFTTDGTVTPRS